MLAKHAIRIEWANEAVNDEAAAWHDPDPASQSGKSVPVVGYSRQAGFVLVVILLHTDDPDKWIGLSGWKANSTYRRIYEEGEIDD